VLVDARGDGVPSVVTDDVHGGRLATEHLVELGHRRVAFIGEPPDNPFGFTATSLREQGCRQVLAGIGEEPVAVEYCEHDRLVSRDVAAQLLRHRDRPTAIFASSDVQASGVLLAAAEGGVRVPEDLSVIGFDDIDISMYAGITTIRQPLFESGRLGAELLLRRLADGTGDVEPLAHELPVELVVRATTAAPAGARRGRAKVRG
ncbi:MAG TPA: substrate-binding domain-containing protein, partial [Acidimicrobiales bacterium]|nr:substrate-binding domain-containing protein [Acidimicrobiales bacterium]